MNIKESGIVFLKEDKIALTHVGFYGCCTNREIETKSLGMKG